MYTFKKKARSRLYPAETIIDVDYADDLALLTNTPAQAESLLYSLQQAAEDIVLHGNVNETHYMCFKREGAVSTLNGRSLKFVKISYLGSSISYTENDINLY